MTSSYNNPHECKSTKDELKAIYITLKDVKETNVLKVLLEIRKLRRRMNLLCTVNVPSIQ